MQPPMHRRAPVLLLLALALMAALLAAPAAAQQPNPIDFDLRTWQAFGEGDWDVSADGGQVVQRANTDPGFFVSPEPLIDATITGRFAVETTNDDDYVGFVLGYQGPDAPGSLDHDYVLLSWKQADQGGFGGCTARAGFTLGRMQGTIPPPGPEGDAFRLDTFWCQEQVTDDPRYQVLDTVWDPAGGWEDDREYEFEITYTADRFTLALDGVEVMDVAGTFPEGSFGFYNYSQPNARYSGFAQQPMDPSPVDPDPTTPVRPGDPGTSRLEGTGAGDAIDVAIQLCQELAGDGVGGQVTVARVDDFADALSATQLPFSSCILYTPGGPDAALDPRTAAEIDRVFGDAGGLVNIMGGTNAVSSFAENLIVAEGWTARRLAGPTRFETAEATAQAAITDNELPPREVVVAYGLNWPDAVTAGAWVAARPGAVLVLSDTASLHPTAQRVVASSGATEQIVVGGTGVLGPQVEQALFNPRRVEGVNRMATAVAVAEELWPSIPASGEDFVFVNLDRADAWTLALAAAPLSAAIEGPQLGLRTASLPAETEQYLLDLGITDIPSRVILGDLSFVSDDVVRSIEVITGG